MRISTGIFKGLYLKPLKGIRPTQDKVKNAVFDILQDSIQGAKFLELFAGSGIVGFEAISRGAKEVIFIENNPNCARSIKETILKIGFRIQGKNTQLYRQDAMRAIEQLFAARNKFDIVFADPPYYRKNNQTGKFNPQQQIGAKKILQALSRYDIINPAGLVIIQASRREILQESYANLRLIRSYKYGDTLMYLFQKTSIR